MHFTFMCVCNKSVVKHIVLLQVFYFLFHNKDKKKKKIIKNIPKLTKHRWPKCLRFYDKSFDLIK